MKYLLLFVMLLSCSSNRYDKALQAYSVNDYHTAYYLVKDSSHVKSQRLRGRIISKVISSEHYLHKKIKRQQSLSLDELQFIEKCIFEYRYNHLQPARSRSRAEVENFKNP